MLGLSRLDGEPPARHLAQPTDPGANTESPLPAELYRDKPKRLIAGRHQGELGPTEDVGRNLREFWLGVHSAGIPLHDLLQFQSCEFTVVIDGRTDADELDVLVLIHDSWKDIGDEVDTLLD